MLMEGGAIIQSTTNMVKIPSVMWETWVGSLGWDDPLEKGKAIHSSILAWRIPWTVQSVGVAKSDTTEQLSLSPSSKNGLWTSVTSATPPPLPPHT